MKLKSILINTVTGLSLLTCSGAIADKASSSIKIGVVDFQRVIEESTTAKKMQADLERQFRPQREKMMAKQNQLQDKVTELKKNQAVMSETQVETLQREIMDLKRELERGSEDLQRDVQAAQSKEYKQFIEKLRVLINKLGQTKQFDLILEKSVIVYMAGGFDITDQLVEQLN